MKKENTMFEEKNNTPSLKEEITERFEKMFCSVHKIEIATLSPGFVAVWINGYRTSNYNIKEHRFTAEN